MQLLHFEISQSNDLNTFIAFWCQLYSYANEEVYKNAIAKQVFEKDDLRELFKWKNGMELNTKKQQSLKNKILSKLTAINDFKKSQEVDIVAFQKEFSNLTFVWKFFLLHCMKPKHYPIYDQHIHRTFLFIYQEVAI